MTVVPEIGWNRLRRESNLSSELGIPSLPLTVTTPSGAARLALGSDGEARLLLPLAAGAAFPAIKDSAGLQLRDTVFNVSGDAIRFVDVSCRGERLEEVFQKLVGDVLRRLSEGKPVAASVEGAIADFRRLLLGAQRKPPSLRDAAGLLGELLVLLRLLEEDAGAWKSWTGPGGHRHDFRAGQHAIEVKASLRSHERVIHVSAIDQLMEPEDGELTLAYFMLEPVPAGGLDVPELVTRVLALATDASEIEQRLDQLEYSAEAAADWADFGFSVLVNEYYDIRPGFPRLIPSNFEQVDLPPGVSHFRYRADLDYASEFILNAEEAAARLERIIKCLHQS